MSRRLTLRLVPIAVVAWGCALLTVEMPAAAPALALSLWATVLILLVAGAMLSARHNHVVVAGRLLAVLVLAIAGAAGVASHVALAQPDRIAVADLATGGGRAVTVTAVVTGKVERRAGGMVAFDGVATGIAIGSTRHAVDAPIVVQADPARVEGRPALDVGAVVEVRGTARPSMPGDRAVLEVSASRGVTIVKGPSGPLVIAAGLRQSLVAAVSGLPGAGAGLVPGLAVGDTTAVGQQLDAQMKQSSLSHLTAVSGANCALVVGLAFLTAALAGARRALRVVAGLGALAGFVLLVTPEPSVLRAATMAAIAMLAVLLGRPAAGMAILSLAITVLLVADPWLAGSLGFALSTAATASLLLFARPLARGLSRFLPRALAYALSVPLAAQLACGPLLVLITPVVPIYGVLANLLAEPAAPLATIVGLAACLAAPLPVLQAGLAALAWVPASWIAGTAETVTAIPGDLVPWLEGWPGAAALTVVGLAIGILVAVAPSGSRRMRAIRGTSLLLVAVVAGVSAGGVALQGVAGRWTIPTTWSVIACDVGQGDAVLLRSEGVVMLVDTGPAPEPLNACLERVGVGHVDLLVLTHFDLDHVGGVAALTGRVGMVLHGPPYGPAAGILGVLDHGGARIVDAHRGLQGALGGAIWRVVWPIAGSPAFAPGNDESVVIDIRGGGIPPALLLGDLSASPQRAIAASGHLEPPYAIVKVAHHGSADQDAGLYEIAEPTVALITVGAGNDYGHPRAETLTTLSDLGVRIFRTDQDGLIAVTSVSGGVQVWHADAVGVGGGR